MGFDWKSHDVCLTEEEGGYVVAFPHSTGSPTRAGDLITWWELSGRQRAFVARRVHTERPDLLEFDDQKGRRLSLRPLTLGDYARVRLRLGPDNPKFTDLEKLRAAVRDAVRRSGT